MSETVRVQAVSVGQRLDLDSVSLGVVHSVYHRAVNLTMHGDLWTLLAEGKADLPFGICVPLANFDRLGLRRGDPVHIRSEFVGVRSRLVVDCRTTPRWAAVYEMKPEPGLEHRLAVLAKVVRNKSWCDSAAMAQAVRAAVSDATALGNVVATVVGRGPGATPAGDDVLIGVLAVLTSPHAGAAGVRATELFGRALLPLLPTTTELSGHLLRQAANGLFGRDVHELVSALIGASSPEQLNERVRRVVETGATSGADLCEGLLAFAPAYLGTSNERASA